MNKDEIKDLLEIIALLIEVLAILRDIIKDKSKTKKPKG